jgi:hypothetical protein
MRIQFTNIVEHDEKRATVVILISADPQAEQSGGVYVRLRLQIPSDPAPVLPELQLVALQSLRSVIGERIQAIRQMRGRD